MGREFDFSEASNFLLAIAREAASLLGGVLPAVGPPISWKAADRKGLITQPNSYHLPVVFDVITKRLHTPVTRFLPLDRYANNLE